MKKRLLKLCSIVLTLVMIFNMLPHQVLADTLTTEEMDLTSVSIPAEKVTPDLSASDVVEEVTENRTEFSKEFRLSNGLHMATVYNSAVHYEKDGVWEEIDNTLVASISGTDSVFTNTAGVWNISFPQNLSTNNQITISKDGYTLRFGLAGLLSNNGSEVMSSTASANASEQISAGTLAVQEAKAATAEIQALDTATILAEATHPETVAFKLNSRLQYSNVYSNTNVVYDLQSNKLKESVIISRYDSDLRGYRYTLDVGNMIPVLNEDNSIWFYDSTQENVVMAMPAPFLFDAENVYNYDVDVVLQGSGNTYTLLYLLPEQWLAAEDRAWPVVLDPVISAEITPSNIRDISVAEYYVDSNTTGTVSCGYANNWGIHRFFVKYAELPEISSSDVIVGASMELVKYGTTYNNTDTMSVEVHKVLETWDSVGLTWSNMPDTNPTVEDFARVCEYGYYYWDVTDIVRGWYDGQNTGMMFKASDNVEEDKVLRYKEFCSSDYGLTYRPSLVIYFRNNNGLENYWDYTASSAGRAGTGYVNNYTGNLVWVRGDIGFGGNRMPISISHVYNANDSQNNTFGLGYGWRTNFNQRIYSWDEDSDYYVWEDGDGTQHYFLYDSSTGLYYDEDGLELVLDDYLPGIWTYSITDKNGNTSYFDSRGRLGRMENNQDTVSSIDIEYESTSYRISYMIDGVGRYYNFDYTNNLLTKIRYTGLGDDVVSYVSFGYGNNNLTSVTDKDGKSSTYGYSGHLLTSATDIDGYTLEYAYSTPIESWQPYRVISIKETDDDERGREIFIQYDHNQTTFIDYFNEIEQIVQFNNWGNTVSIQDGEGRAQYAQYATDSDPEGGKGNQLSIASKLQNTVGNMLSDNSFELGTTWTANGATVSNSTSYHYHGARSMRINTSGAGGASVSFVAEAGKTYTFSAYVETENSSAYLMLGNQKSETLAAMSEFTRLEVSYTNESSSNQTITAKIMNTGTGYTYMDCVQLEQAPTASRYNLIVDGDFRDTDAWSSSSGYDTVETAAAPQLSKDVYKLSGTYISENRISQTVKVSGSKGDTFVLAGWAKGNSIPLTQFENSLYDSSGREFAIIAEFNHTDGTTSKEMYVRFNPDVDNWQYAAAPIVATKAYSSITVYLAYDHNANDMLFDGIQLYKEQFGNSYTYDEDGNVISVVDLQKKNTTYEYDSDNNLTHMIQDGQAKMTYTYDDYHNVKTATSAEGLSYSFEYDTYGNNTSVSITSGGVTMTSSATYSDGNRLATTTDAAGNVTTYSYNADTNVLEWVKYPNDTDSTKTTYTYDDMYRLASAAASTGTQNLSASYTYENDLLKSITTGSTTYNFAYGSFGLRSTIKVGSTTLASYTYTNRNNYLDTLAYGNGDSVEYIYDHLGRVVEEEYEDGDTVTYAYDNNGALATVTDSATGRTTTYYYDFTDRLMKYTESGGGIEHSVSYTYDDLNNLTRMVEVINGTTRGKTYTYDDDNRVQTVSYALASKTYTYDGFGRISQRATKHNGTTIATDTITYRTVNGKATGQVSSLATKAGTYSYTYDANGNIKTVTFGGKTTTYTYDKQNQLTREDNQAAGKTWVWTYDNAGNITSRKEYAYTTGTLGSVQDTVSYTYGSNWGDLLTAYDGHTISYDDIGNPLSDGTWTYTWEHGRELATMSGGGSTWTYTYDANGMRTKRTNGSTTYTYAYIGSQLTEMTVGSNRLLLAYDASGSPLAVTYNGTAYYYVTNLQGDVVAILNSSGSTVVTYTYDAWGNILTTSGSMASTLGVHNPLRYRGYVFDQETELYYLQSRYYDPQVGRFINADKYPSTGQGLLGNNMFTYCNNNPVMGADPYGNAPEWWQWAVSGAMVLTGIAMVATGVGGVAGGALICAGANSIIGSYTSEAAGGSSTAGWVGGMITGAISGTGAGVAGELFIGATNTANAACIGNLAASGATAFGSGVLGSAAGQFVTASIDGAQLEPQAVVESSLTNGAINSISGLGAGMGNAIQSMPLISTTTTCLANSLTAAWSVAVEVVCDFWGTVAGFFS